MPFSPTTEGRLPRPYFVSIFTSCTMTDHDSGFLDQDRSKVILGRVYEYFLTQFSSAEGKYSGQFYTPRCVVQVLAEKLALYKGRVYDPCCGSADMCVQSEKFVEEHGDRIGDIAVYSQESNSTARRLAKLLSGEITSRISATTEFI